MFLHENERTFEKVHTGSVFQPPVSRSGERRLRERYDLSGQACIQRKLRVVLRGVEKDSQYKEMKEHPGDFLDPEQNYENIRQIIERTIGAQYWTYPNMQEIARELGVTIAPEPARAPLPEVDKTRFSHIPEDCHDEQLEGILHNPTQGRFQYGGETYYHHTGHPPAWGKPIWKIDETSGKIEIVGMYEHGGTNKIYHKRDRRDGAGPDTIRLP